MNAIKLYTGRSKQKLKTRNRILVAAQRLLRKQLAFTLEDVAKEADMSRATIYRYFSNIDVLCAEAAINIDTKSVEELLEETLGKSFTDSILHIHSYFNQLAQMHEMAFRKYLSIVLDASTKKDSLKVERGARRPTVLKHVLERHNGVAKKEDEERLLYITTVLSGFEALIANKDVNHLNNEESNEVLSWALRMIINGLELDEQE